jgi:hypothetical protein
MFRGTVRITYFFDWEKSGKIWHPERNVAGYRERALKDE